MSWFGVDLLTRCTWFVKVSDPSAMIVTCNSLESFKRIVTVIFITDNFIFLLKYVHFFSYRGCTLITIQYSACVVCLTICSIPFQQVMAVDAVLVLHVSPACDSTSPLNSSNKHRWKSVSWSLSQSVHSTVVISTVENQSVDHSHSRCNFLYGGACWLEIISASNDEVLEGDLNSVPENIFGNSNNA